MAITPEMAIDAVERVLGRKVKDAGPITTDTELESLGFDSLDMIELFVALEEAGDVELDPESAEGIATVGELATLRPLGRGAIPDSAGLTETRG